MIRYRVAGGKRATRLTHLASLSSTDKSIYRKREIGVGSLGSSDSDVVLW